MKIMLTVNNNNKVIISHVGFIKLVKLGCWFGSSNLSWDTRNKGNIVMGRSEWYKRQWVAHGN